MIKLNIGDTILESLVSSLHDTSNKAAGLSIAIDVCATIFCIIKGYDLFTILLVDIGVTLLVAAVFSVIQTRSSIRRIIKDNAVESTNKLFKEEIKWK
jgi:hypothetical protein